MEAAADALLVTEDKQLFHAIGDAFQTKLTSIHVVDSLCSLLVSRENLSTNRK